MIQNANSVINGAAVEVDSNEMSHGQFSLVKSVLH